MEWCPQSRPWSRSVGPAMLRALLVLVLFFQPSSASHADEQHSYHTKIAFRNTKGHLVSESKEHNSYSVSLQSLLEYHFQLPKRRTEHILQEWPCPVTKTCCLMSVCAPERHRVLTVTPGQQELTTPITTGCSVPFPCWCGSDRAGAAPRGGHSTVRAGEELLALPSWKAELQMPAAFCSPSLPVPPCSPETALRALPLSPSFISHLP